MRCTTRSATRVQKIISEASESGSTNTRSASEPRSNSRMPSRPSAIDPHLIPGPVAGVFGRVRRAHIRDGDLVSARDGGVGQPRSAVQRFENRMRPADALGFNPQNRPPEPAAQLGGVVRRRLVLDQWNGNARQLVHRFRPADQIFGEVRAVLEQIQGRGRQFRLGIETLQARGIVATGVPENIRRGHTRDGDRHGRSRPPGRARAAPAPE